MTDRRKPPRLLRLIDNALRNEALELSRMAQSEPDRKRREWLRREARIAWNEAFGRPTGRRP